MDADLHQLDLIAYLPSQRGFQDEYPSFVGKISESNYSEWHARMKENKITNKIQMNYQGSKWFLSSTE